MDSSVETMIRTPVTMTVIHTTVMMMEVIICTLMEAMVDTPVVSMEAMDIIILVVSMEALDIIILVVLMEALVDFLVSMGVAIHLPLVTIVTIHKRHCQLVPVVMQVIKIRHITITLTPKLERKEVKVQVAI